MPMSGNVRLTKSEMKYARSLAQPKVRDHEKKFVIEGWKTVQDALRSGFRLDFIGVTKTFLDDPEYRAIIREVRTHGIALKELSDVELKQVCDTVHAQGIVALAQQKSRTLDEVLASPAHLVVLADHIADPGNLGTMIRTCDWFSADALVLSEGCVDLYNEKVVRSTAGSIFHIPVVEHTDVHEVITKLGRKGFKIFATAGEAKVSYRDAEYGEKNLIIFGNESSGIGKETRQLADETISIPRKGKAESLNVGVSTGIILSHIANSD